MSTTGKHAVLHTHFGSLLGVGGKATSIFTSRSFKYKGARGSFPRSVRLVVRRRANDATLLSVAGNSATYSAAVIAAKSGNAVAAPISNAPLSSSSKWTRVGPKRINRHALRRGHTYKIQISTMVTNGAQVIPGFDADFTRAKVVASRHHH